MGKHGGNGSFAMGAGHSYSSARIEYLTQGHRALDDPEASLAKVIELLVLVRHSRCVYHQRDFWIPEILGYQLRAILKVDINPLPGQ